MTTDEDKVKLAKLLQGLEIPDIKLSEKCLFIVQEFYEKYDKELEEENEMFNEEIFENPYKVDSILLEENERKLHELRSQGKRSKKNNIETNLHEQDPKKPWRTNSDREKLLRIDLEIKHHKDKEANLILPLSDEDMQDLLQDCHEELDNSSPVSACKLRETVEAARKNLPNFQYKSLENSTATSILPDAHVTKARHEDNPPNLL